VRVKRPKVSEHSTTVGLDETELIELLAAAEADGSRSTALITLLALNGLRVGEALSRDVEHLTYDFGHWVIELTRKGGERSTEALAPATSRALEAYLGERITGPIFLNRNGGRLSEPSVWRLVRHLARKAGRPAADRLSPHSLRHSAITAALDAGVPFRDVQDFAGHADPRTTRRYDRSRNSLDRHATYALAARLGRKRRSSSERAAHRASRQHLGGSAARALDIHADGPKTLTPSSPVPSVHLFRYRGTSTAASSRPG